MSHGGAHLIAFPFNIGINGNVETLPDDSADYYAQLIAVLVLTRPGERRLVPLFGLTDPVFSELDASELTYKVGIFGPPVRIDSVKVQPISDRIEDVLVSFTSYNDGRNLFPGT